MAKVNIVEASKSEEEAYRQMNERLQWRTYEEMAQLLGDVACWVGPRIPADADPSESTPEPYGPLFYSAMKMTLLLCPDLPAFRRTEHLILSE